MDKVDKGCLTIRIGDPDDPWFSVAGVFRIINGAVRLLRSVEKNMTGGRAALLHWGIIDAKMESGVLSITIKGRKQNKKRKRKST